MWNNKEGTDVDELLAMLGYKVKLAYIVDVAQKIEHLEGVFGNAEGLSQFASDSVHYNPSDLNSWLEYVICELNPSPELVIIDDSFVNDSALQAMIYLPAKKNALKRHLLLCGQQELKKRTDRVEEEVYAVAIGQVPLLPVAERLF
ncbi:putative transcription factor GRAS family [Helianthus debilis subsp. tardiflorus]